MLDRNVYTKEVTMYKRREMKNKEQLEARQILNETWTFKEAETFTLKGFGSRSHSCANERVTHAQMNDSLMCKFCNQRRLSITWENQLLCLCHLWKYKTKKLVTGLAAMICISTVKIRARPWGGIYKQMIWLRFGKVSVRLFCREYKR